MWELVVAFALGMAALWALAEEPKLEDMADREIINLMADRSRRGKPAGARQRSRYSRAYIKGYGHGKWR